MSSTEEEEEEERQEPMKNNKITLMQYVHGMDLFDGQSCTTASSAATTIMIGTPSYKKGRVRHL